MRVRVVFFVAFLVSVRMRMRGAIGMGVLMLVFDVPVFISRVWVRVGCAVRVRMDTGGRFVAHGSSSGYSRLTLHLCCT
jgi:hypothetical protein